MQPREPGWYLIRPTDNIAEYWNGSEFTGATTPKFRQQIPVFDESLERAHNRRTRNTQKAERRWQAADSFAKGIRNVFFGGIALFVGVFLVAGVVGGSNAAKEREAAEQAQIAQQQQEAVAEPAPIAAEPVAPPPPVAPLPVTYENCDAVWEQLGHAIKSGEPGYETKLDRDNDGVACERD